MYGDNKANLKNISLEDIQRRIEVLRQCTKIDVEVGYDKKDVLALSVLSQEITDALNQLYEQMKGE